MNIRNGVIEIAKNAKKAATALARLSSDTKDCVLSDMAEALTRQTGHLIKENAKDVEKARQMGLSAAMMDRLMLNETVIEGIARGLKEVACLPDPIGKVTSMWRRPNGLLVGRMRIPLGVIGIIYESRPNVTVDAAALCLKSGNAVILRVARFETEGGRIHRHIGTGFIDHADYTQRDSHAADEKAIWPPPHGCYFSYRVRETGHFFQTSCNALNRPFIQREPVNYGGGKAHLPGFLNILCIFLDEKAGLPGERLGHVGQDTVLCIRRQAGKRCGRFLRIFCYFYDAGFYIHVNIFPDCRYKFCRCAANNRR